MKLLFGIPEISEWVIILVASLIILALPLIILIDILRHCIKGANDKLIWVAIVLFMSVSGSVPYFIIGRQQRVL